MDARYGLRRRSLCSAIALFALGGALGVAGMGCAGASPDVPRPYVFGWPFVDVRTLAPRGGTTRGAEVVVASEPSAAWQQLQAPELIPLDRDRAAILALAGDYRASFDFLESVLYEPGAEPARPYRSWGTERIEVLEERPDFVSLQHVMVMFTVDEEGRRQGPFVQKHWRQDWRYEPTAVLRYLGDGRFGLRHVAADEQAGAWSQTVYQVDDSPRFAAIGRWHHGPQSSVWRAPPAWRPLPRRERVVRSDYQVLAGAQRITVLPTGWVHEQDNEKLVLSADGTVTGSRAREIGLDRYERITGFDFAAAEAYWDATAPFWAKVRDAWSRRIASGGDFTVAGRCDGEPGFAASFRVAMRLEEGELLDPATLRSEAQRIVDCLVQSEDVGGY